jgi:hypothetical protein
MTNYTISKNETFNSTEIKFEGKPSEAVREALKALRFRWHGTKKVWYGYKTEAEAIEAINNADQEAKQEEPETYSIETTNAYMGAVGFVGSNAGKRLYGAELSQAIRDALKKDGIKATVSKNTYSMGQSICVTVKANKDDFANANDDMARPGHHMVNHYNIDRYECFTDEFKAKLHRANLIANSFNYSDSNSMVDYFDANFYFDLYIKVDKAA